MSTRKLSVCFATALAAVIIGCSKNDPPRQPSVTVSITTVRRAAVPYVVTANGIAEPKQTVAIEEQVNGILKRVYFSDGQAVQAGQDLLPIHSRPYMAVQHQANGQF